MQCLELNRKMANDINYIGNIRVDLKKKIKLTTDPSVLIGIYV